MADSVDTSAPVEFSLKVADKEIGASVGVNKIIVNRSVNKIPSAIITIIDGDMPSGSFPVSDDEADIALQPGKTLEISAGYGSTKTKIFSGLIVKHGLSIGADNSSEIIIECKEAAIKMTYGRKNENYVQAVGGEKIKDDATLKTIIGEYSDLTADVDDTTAEFGSLVKYNITDWDFLVARAEANGMLVIVCDDKVSVKTPDTSTAAVFTAEYGKDIFECRANIDASHQLSKATGVAWDLTKLAVVKESVSATADTSSRASINGTLSDVVGLSDFRLQSPTATPTASLKQWATGQLMKSSLSQLRGFIRIQGRADANVGDMIELKGIGKRFSGNVFVSGVEHHIEEGNWITEVSFGCSSDWFTQHGEVAVPSASGLLGPADGLQIGIVKQLDQDPDNQYRILVTVPILEASTPGVWARLSTFYASSTFGAFFVPEIGDEVVLGYLNNDPSYPVILGSLYSAKNKAPEELTADNFKKSLITKTKLTVEFDDEKKIITLKTPGGNSIVMDDDGKSIVLTDLNDNKVSLESGGITLDSPKDITLKATGGITLEATKNVDIKATGDATVEGMNVNLTAKTSLAAKGSASAELSASGNTTIKGAMVMIN